MHITIIIAATIITATAAAIGDAATAVATPLRPPAVSIIAATAAVAVVLFLLLFFYVTVADICIIYKQSYAYIQFFFGCPLLFTPGKFFNAKLLLNCHVYGTKMRWQ